MSMLIFAAEDIVEDISVEQQLRNLIKHLGFFGSVILLTVLLIAAVACLQLVLSRTIWQEVLAYPLLSVSILIAVTAPIVLYFLVRLISQLDHSEEKLRALSIMDDLTDVYNRRYFIETLQRELAKAQRYGNEFSLIAIDIDNFKVINDQYGHFAGDAVLKALANTCMNNLRTMDVFSRFGGEEFMFLIPESDKADASAFAERIREELENTPVMHDHQQINFTVSIGVKIYDEFHNTTEGLLKAVDDALYMAKAKGRNCVVVKGFED